MLFTSLFILTILIGGPYAVYVVWYVLLSPNGCPAEKSFESKSSVSVVLPTYNEAAIVESKLASLVELEYPAEKLEIVVVDSSTDETTEVVRSFAVDHEGDHKIRLIKESERRGVATAVNIGVGAAKGEIVFRTDCDSRVGKDTIDHAVATLQDSSIGGVMGQQTEVLGESQVEVDYRNLQARNQALESHLDSTFIVHGPCFAFRRLEFEPIHSNSLADDTEIGVNLRRKGKRVVLDPAMEFIESSVSDIRGRRQRKDRRAMGLIQMLVRSRDMLGRYGWYGRVILPSNWWFMMIAPWLMLLLVGTTIAAGFAWFDLGGLVVPIGLVGFVLLGQRDALGPVQPLYAIFDSNLSLTIAAVRLLRGVSDGTWEVDVESREAFEK